MTTQTTTPEFAIGAYVRHEDDPQQRAWMVADYWERHGETTFILVDEGQNEYESYGHYLTECHNSEGK